MHNENYIYIYQYLAKCPVSGMTCGKFRKNSGSQNYSGTKFALIRVPLLFLLQFVPIQKFTLNPN